MICYAANGSKIQFYAIDGATRPDPFVPLTEELNIGNFLDRVEILQTVINIARIIVTIRDSFPVTGYPAGKRKQIGNSEITFNFDDVEKQFLLIHLPYGHTNPRGRVGFLKGMYEHAKHRRGLVEVKDGPGLNNTYYKVTLKTRGLGTHPRTGDELRRMTKDLVSGLAWLHSGDYLHRDIRLPNILYDPATSQYFFIDFEHGGRESQEIIDRGAWLKEWDEGTFVGGRYTKMSEMYQLGRLLKNEFGGILLEHGNDFVAKLEAKEMTADEALQHQWIHDVI